MANDPTNAVVVAPEYRYFTADLMTNEILAEIPFAGVTYERALAGAGSFDGTIPVITSTNNLNLYDSTMPGQTALYVLRNNVCVWGGIIWDRTYNLQAQSLDVSASEFTSYFQHRLLWRDYDHSFPAIAVFGSGTAVVSLTSGTTNAIKAGASVQLVFSDAETTQYSGYYTVASAPYPTSSSFNIVGGVSRIGVVSYAILDDVLTVNTSGMHGFNTGDTIYVNLGGTIYDGYYIISNPGGSVATQFTVTVSTIDVTLTAVTGYATRAVPNGVYSGVTVLVQTDTYDFIRSLLSSAEDDFLGITLAETLVQPGTSTYINVNSRSVSNGVATLTTSTPHGLTVGQAVYVENVSPVYNGEYEVTAVPNSKTIQYALGGTEATTTMTPDVLNIVSYSLANGIVTINTATAHGFSVGQIVDIDCGFALGSTSTEINGDSFIVSVPTTTSFTYLISDTTTVIPLTTFTVATAAVGATTVTATNYVISSNVATITTATSSGFSAGNSVTLAGVTPSVAITDKELVASTSTATITTATPHEYVTGDSVVITGVQDSANLIFVSSTTSAVKFYTQVPHNFSVGNTVTISNALDTYTLTNESITSNVATLTTSEPHNLVTGNTVTTSDLVDTIDITTVSITDDVATLTLAENHNFSVNTSITVVNLIDQIAVTGYAAQSGVAYLYTDGDHNFAVGDVVTVAGVNSTFNGSQTITAVTPDTIQYALGTVVENTIVVPINEYTKAGNQVTRTETQTVIEQNDVTIAAADSSGTITGTTSVLNGTFTLTAITDTTVSYAVTANDMTPVAAYGTTQPTAAGLSILNGVFTVASTPSTTTFTYLANPPSTIVQRTASTTQAILTFTPVATTAPYFVGEKITVSGVSNSQYNGTFLITAVTPTTVTYAITGGTAEALTASTGSIVRATNNLGSVAIPVSVGGEAPAISQLPSIFTGTHTITALTANTFTFAASVTNAIAYYAFTGTATIPSTFNGTHTITAVPTTTSFTYTLASTYNISEVVVNALAFATLPSLFNGTHTITAVNPVNNTFSFALTHSNMDTTLVQGYGLASMSPSVAVSTYGPYPSSANINMGFFPQTFSGVNITPTDFVGSGVTNIGDALTTYSESVNGFDYRVDCDFDPTTGTFTKTFVLLPIDFSDPPGPGMVSDPSRFGADKLVFEYPGNIIDLTFAESADTAATRFFAVGDTSATNSTVTNPTLGGEATTSSQPISTSTSGTTTTSATATTVVPYSAATANDLLEGTDGVNTFRAWPLLDDTQTISGITDESVLYAYAQSYLAEARPPAADLTVTVNGSLQPLAGTYGPGDWCSVNVNDPFVQGRLASGLEPRSDVIVRKIDSFTVTVPDGSTFPEQVVLTLVQEWEVDSVG